MINTQSRTGLRAWVVRGSRKINYRCHPIHGPINRQEQRGPVPEPQNPALHNYSTHENAKGLRGTRSDFSNQLAKPVSLLEERLFFLPRTCSSAISHNLVSLQNCCVSPEQSHLLGFPVQALFDPLATTRAQLLTQFTRIKQSGHLVGEIDGIVR